MLKNIEQFMIIKINIQLCIHCLPNDLQDVIIAKARINNVHQSSISFSSIYVASTREFSYFWFCSGNECLNEYFKLILGIYNIIQCRKFSIRGQLTFTCH